MFYSSYFTTASHQSFLNVFYFVLISFCRLDDLILEAIKKLKEPSGSNRTTISSYIEVFPMKIPCSIYYLTSIVHYFAAYQLSSRVSVHLILAMRI